MRSNAKIGYYCAAGALAVASALAYDAIPDLPLAPQSDEPKKADFVLRGGQDFLQPLLLEATAERFLEAGSFPSQPDIVRRYASGYGELLAPPAIVVESTAGSFSYRNVPLRIVARRSDAARLAAVVAKLGPLPDTRLTVVPGRASTMPARGTNDHEQPFSRAAR